MKRILLAAATIALGLALVWLAVLAYPRQPGIDFYQFWGVPLAEKTAELSTPYSDPQGYARVLNRLSDASGDAKLRAANAARRQLEPMGTPLLYASFALMPRDYALSHALFTIALHVALVWAVFRLATLRGASRWAAACIAVAVALTFQPFAHDVRVGNLNSLQLAFLAAWLAFAQRRAGADRPLVDTLYLASLALFVLVKPNTVLIALALGLHYWAARGTRRLALGAISAAIVGAVAVVAAAAFFGEPTAWGAWIDAARRMDRTIPLTIDQGNVSLPMYLAGHGGALGPAAYGLILAGLVATLFTLLAVRGPGRSIASLVATFGDPWLAMSLGVLLTFAASPLVWPHYHVLALVPIFALSRFDGGWDAAATCAAIAFAALSVPVFQWLAGAGQIGALKAVMLGAWLFLVPGLLLRVAASTALRAPSKELQQER